MSSQPDAAPHPRHWLRCLPGVALLAVVVAGALHFAQARDFARIAENAEPGWLALAGSFQVATYVTAGQIYRRLVRAGGDCLSLPAACRAAVTKLFVDHTLPSAGLGGTVVLAASLVKRGVRRSIAAATIVVELAAHYAAHAACLALALVILASRGESSALVWLVSVVFFLFAAGLSGLVLGLSGRRREVLPRGLLRLRPLRVALEFIEQADPRLARSARSLLEASVYQLVIICCDVATLLLLMRALGTVGSPGDVFASFMLASISRTFAGLGAFDATFVVTSHLAGVSTVVALGTTLMFRVLRFWLPMLPGLWFSRSALLRPSAAPRRSTLAFWSRHSEGRPRA